MEKGFLELQEEMDEVVQQNALKWFASQLKEADSNQKQEVLDTQSKWNKPLPRREEYKEWCISGAVAAAAGDVQDDLPPFVLVLHLDRMECNVSRTRTAAIEVGV